MLGFGPVDYVLDEDDLPRLADPEHFDLLPQRGPQMVWEHAPAAVVPPSVYRTDLPQRYAELKGCNGGFVWSSVLRQIQRDGGAVEPWTTPGRREDAA